MRSTRTWILTWIVGGLLLLELAALLSGCAPHRRRVAVHSDMRDRARLERLGEWASGPKLLRVGLCDGQAAVQLELSGPVRLLDASGASLGTVSVPGTLTCAASAGELHWSVPGGAATTIGGESGAVALHLVPLDPRHVLSYAGNSYEGEVLVLLRGDSLTLVNVIDLETYLRGVVPWEIGRPGESGLAALEAQAVAARTYTVAHLAERQEHGCDVWADTRDQVYKGRDGGDPWCDQAIANTKGLVLRYGGAEIEAYYSSTCGGVTSNVHEVWQRAARPYLRSHDDRGRDGRVHCAGSSQFSWQEHWARAELETVLQKSLPAYLDWVAASPSRQKWAGRVFEPAIRGADPRTPGALRDVRVKRRTTSGRVDVLELVTTAGMYRIRGDRTRWVLAPASGRFSILRSAWFDVASERDRQGGLVGLRVDGRGFGHGVGLCQVGALRMAELGYGYREILEHYYPGARLETAWLR